MVARLPTFWIKIGLIAALVALADFLVFEESWVGANVGLLTLGWLVALVAANPAVVRNRVGVTACAAALWGALIQFERPTLVGFLIFAVGFGVAALSPRAGAAEDVWRWAQRLIVAGFGAFWGPFRDLAALRRADRRRGGVRIAPLAVAAALPVFGGLVFLALFAAANPVISETFAAFHLPRLDLGRLIFWGAMALPVSAALRARGLRRPAALPGMDRDLPGITAGSVIASLVVFNALFALQNGLDVTYLWADARLPGTLTFAEYAHRGAYPLIATALLAGLFVLVFLRPGSAVAGSRLARGLVVVWLAQNLFLVASTMLRTFDYIEAYSLTAMRLAALIWMGMVAAGLALICWRLLAGKSGSWLINANTLVLGVVIAACSVVDLGAGVAAWNVRHAREVGGQGVELDLCYIGRTRGAGVVSLAELERRPLTPEFRDRVSWVRRRLTWDLAQGQANWRGWTWRDARRLERLQQLAGPPPTAEPAREGRACDGTRPKPPPVPPLTPAPKPQT